MKVFDFTAGIKGKQLADVNRANSTAGWLVRKGDRIFKVELTRASEGWGWHSGATIPVYVNEKYQGSEPITAEQFGVGAICFCTGQDNRTKVWTWVVVSTCDWAREACKSGILKSTFSHIMTQEQRAENIAFMVLHLRPELQEADLMERCTASEVDPALVRALIADPVACKRIMDR